MKLSLKLLIIAVSLNLLPVSSGPTIFMHDGFMLEADEVSLSRRAVKQFRNNIIPLLENEQWDKALRKLSAIEDDPKFTLMDRATIIGCRAYIYFSQEKYDLAITHYKKVLNHSGLTYSLQQNALHSLAQLSFIKEDYSSAVDYLNKRIGIEEDAPSHIYSLIAVSHYQLKNFEEAQYYVNTAIQKAETTKGVARENDYLMRIHLYQTLNEELDVLPVYEKLAVHHPKNKYLIQLATLYESRGRTLDMDALKSRETALVDSKVTKTSSPLADFFADVLTDTIAGLPKAYVESKAREKAYKKGYIEGARKNRKRGPQPLPKNEPCGASCPD